MILTSKDYAYLIIIIILLHQCIFSFREYSSCFHKSGAIHPKCNPATVIGQKFLYGGVYK